MRTHGRLPRRVNYLRFILQQFKCIGSNTTPVTMDMAEIDAVDQQNIGNRSTDVFDDVYRMKLLLGAIRALTGVDKRRSYYKNPRTTFKGDSTHEALARKQIHGWRVAGGNSISQIIILLMES